MLNPKVDSIKIKDKFSSILKNSGDDIIHEDNIILIYT